MMLLKIELTASEKELDNALLLGRELLGLDWASADAGVPGLSGYPGLFILYNISQ